MSRSPDAEDLDVDAAGLANRGFIFRAVVVDFVNPGRAIGNVDVLAADVDVIEERLEHPAAIGMRIVTGHRMVFIKIEGNQLRKIEPGILVQADQLAIETHWSRAGRQPKQGRFSRRVVFANEPFDDQGGMSGGIGTSVKY